jgi:hypothetical protein
MKGVNKPIQIKSNVAWTDKSVVTTDFVRCFNNLDLFETTTKKIVGQGNR